MARVRFGRVRFVAPPEPAGPSDITLTGATIDETATAGTACGIVTVIGSEAAGLTSFTCSNAKFTVDFTVGSGFTGTLRLTEAGEGDLASASDEDMTFSCEDANGNTYGPSATRTCLVTGAETDTQIGTGFTIENFNSGGSSVGFVRFGLPIKEGDVPAGSTIVIKRAAGGEELAAQFDGIATWHLGDDSIRLAICSMRDDAGFSASGAKNFVPYARSESSFDNTTSLTLGDITGATDFKLLFENLQQHNGTSASTRGSGSALASFNTMSATATRVTKRRSGPVCDEWEVWGYAKDGADGSGDTDAHLKVTWRVTAWKDDMGDVVSHEVGAVVEQSEWSVANKYRLLYDATLLNGETEIAAYAGVNHPYNSQWMTIDKTSDAGEGRRHWIGSRSTLFYKPDRAYWNTTGLMLPIDLTRTTSAISPITWTPLGACGHSTNLSSTGSYAARGQITNYDCLAFVRQTASDTRYARLAAHAGLHVPRHFRSNNTCTRPGDGGADVANTIISLILDPKTSGEYTFTSDGMPAPVHAYANNATLKDGYVSALGGTGVWSNVGDAAHAGNYSYYLYLLEGDYHFLQSTLDHATYFSVASNGNVFGGRCQLTWYFSAGHSAAFTIPSTQYGGTGGMRGTNPRAAGWMLNLLGSAAAAIPDDDRQSGCIRVHAKQCADYMYDAMQYTPAQQQLNGVWELNSSGSLGSYKPWMNAFIQFGASQMANACGDAEALAFAQMLGNLSVNLWTQGGYAAHFYQSLWTPRPTGWDGSTNDWLDETEGMATSVLCVIDPDNDTITFPGSDALVLTNGDKIFVSNMVGDFTSTAVPSEVTLGTTYKIINASGKTCQICLYDDVGETPIDFTSSTSGSFHCFMSDIANYTTEDASVDVIDQDDWVPIQRASLRTAARDGNVRATEELLDKADTFCAALDTETRSWMTWDIERPAA